MYDKLAFTVEEVAQLLGIGRSSAYQAVHAGEIPSVRIGHRLLVPKQALEAFLVGACGRSECEVANSVQPALRRQPNSKTSQS